MKRAIVIVALAAVPAFADVVHLRGGGRITGEIVEWTDETITVDIGGGIMTARMESVVDVEESVSPLQKYRARAAEVPAGDAEAWRELARWAQNQALSSQAAEAWEQVVAILPDDQEANSALGMVQLNGRWVTQEEGYRARGYVEFEGQWMTPAERQTILSERQARAAREAAERREIDAEIKAIEDEQREEKKKQEAERLAKERARNPIDWGWGAGPTYWPRYGRRWVDPTRQP